MKRFIYKFTLFILPIVSLFGLGLFLPATPRASKSLLFANKAKDELLLHVEPPRIVFVGGSSLSFGINSDIIQNELNINPINTGVHAKIGIQYMLENTIQYVQEGDVIVLALEYDHFYRDHTFVSEQLLRTIFDVDSSKIKLLKLQQVFKLIPYVPKYSLSKFKPTEYFGFTESDVYSVDSFNEYGDVHAHWGLEQREFLPYYMLKGQFNQSVVFLILEFQEEVIKKKAKLFVTYPGLQDVSYSNLIEEIERVASEYERNGLVTLGYPERYRIPDHMLFNTPYHLNKDGMNFRTHLFIEDYKRANLNEEKSSTEAQE